MKLNTIVAALGLSFSLVTSAFGADMSRGANKPKATAAPARKPEPKREEPKKAAPAPAKSACSGGMPGCKIAVNGVCFPAPHPEAKMASAKCEGTNGDYTDKCPTESLVGCCTGIPGEVDRLYYEVLDGYGGVNAQQGADACKTVKGKWTPAK